MNLPPVLSMIVYWMKYFRCFSTWNDNPLPILLCFHSYPQPLANKYLSQSSSHSWCWRSLLHTENCPSGIRQADGYSGKANNLAPIWTSFLNIWLEHLMTSNFQLLLTLHMQFSPSHCTACNFFLLVDWDPSIPQLPHPESDTVSFLSDLLPHSMFPPS